MPLIKSGSRKAVSENIKKKQAQAVAIALDVAREATKKPAPKKPTSAARRPGGY